MKQVPKYILLALVVFAMVWVFASRFTTNEIILSIAGLSAATIALIVFRKKVTSIHFYKFFLLSVSLSMLTIPALGPPEQDSAEKRKLADFPKFRISNVWKFLTGYDTYFSDRFTFRNEAVEFFGMWRLRLFNTSPLPETVAIGNGDWLFQSSKNYIHYTSQPWTREQLDTVITNLEIITKYFDQRGIKYYFAMVPVKERIYPEYVPPFLLYKMKYSREAAIKEALKNHPTVRSVEFRDSLIAGKKRRELYYQKDTHWNEYGAFIGYRCIMRRVKQDFPNLAVLDESNFLLDSMWVGGGDLQVMLGLKNEWKEMRYRMTNKTGIKLVTRDSTMYQTKEVQYNVRELPEKRYGLNLFLIRDSFSQSLKIFIMRNFDRSVLAWTPEVPVANILKEKPEVVVHETLEMFSDYLLTLPPEIAADTTFMNKNFPGYIKTKI